MRTTTTLLSALLLLAGCGGGKSITSPSGTTTGGTTGATTGGTTTNTSNAISVRDFSFGPETTTITPNTTVTWTWSGSALHNVTFDDGTKSANQSSGTFTRTFATAGTFAYHCTIHGAAMSGTVTVR